tara:strand:+ start:8980 stop:9789 length:810 start_codon:yes stop_codon:yes gene_type:complete
MKIFSTKNKLIKFIQNEKNLGFVPTMGSIHEGHISLMKKSISQCTKTIVTIFVNKPQFNRKNDYQKYPRTLKKDISILKKLNINYLYLPSNLEIYPAGINKKIKIDSFSKKLCGAYRPGHFEAVADVINRFIKIIKPSKIYFGEKDMQQLKILENYINKNHPYTKVISCKTIREKNGIPFSSRNILLTKIEKNIAKDIFNLIRKNKKKIINNSILLKLIKKQIFILGAKKIDYVKVLDVNKLIKPYKKNKKYKIFIAYFLNKTRLIDNI